MAEEESLVSKDMEAPEAPEAFKWVTWGWHHTRANREALMKPAVLLIISVVALAGYRFGSNQNSEIIDLKNERIEFLNDQLGAYRDRLKGATPDEAAKQITSLQELVSKQQGRLGNLFPERPRKLTDRQKQIISDNVLKIIGRDKQLLIISASFGDSPEYAQDFYKTLKNSGVNGFDSTTEGYCASDEHGIIIAILDPTRPSEIAVEFTDMLKDADLDPKIHKWPVEDYFKPDLDFSLFICSR